MVWNVIIYWFIGILIVFSDASNVNEIIPYLNDEGNANVERPFVFRSLLKDEPYLDLTFDNDELTNAICPNGYKLCKHSINHCSRCVKTTNPKVRVTTNTLSAIDDYYECEEIPTIDPDIFHLFAAHPTLESNLEPSNHDDIRCAVTDSIGDKLRTRYFTPKNRDYTHASILNAKRIQESDAWRSAKVNPRFQIQYHVFCGKKEKIQNAVESWYRQDEKHTEESTKPHYGLYIVVILVLFCYGGCVYSAKCVDNEDTNNIQQQQHDGIFARSKHFKSNKKHADRVMKQYTHQFINYSDAEPTSEATTTKKEHQFSSSTFIMNIEDLEKIQYEQHEPDQFINFSDLEYTSEKTLLTDSNKIHEVSRSNIIIKENAKEM